MQSEGAGNAVNRCDVVGNIAGTCTKVLWRYATATIQEKEDVADGNPHGEPAEDAVEAYWVPADGTVEACWEGNGDTGSTANSGASCNVDDVSRTRAHMGGSNQHTERLPMTTKTPPHCIASP